MSLSPTVPMIAPDGTSGEIPSGKVQAATQAGFKLAVPMTAPNGGTGYIPVDRASAAIQSGFKQTDVAGVSMTANPKGEGTYAVKTPIGGTIQVPYSNVPVLQGLQGYSLTSDDASRFQKDSANDSSLHVKPYLGFTPGNIASNVGTGLKQLGQGAVTALSDIGGAILPQSLGGDPINNLALVRHVVDPMQAEAAKATAAQPNGTMTASGVAHNVAAGIPVVGPWAANIAEQAASGDPGGAIARAGTQVLAPKVIGPLADAAIQGASKAALLGKTPVEAMTSALKPSTVLTPEARAGMAQTMLQNEIPVSLAGVGKLGDLIDDLNQKIKDQVNADPTRPIDPNAVATRADVAKAKFANQVNAQPDLNAIEASRQQFLTEQGAKPGTPAIAPQPTGILDSKGNPIMDSGAPAKPATPAPDMNASDAQTMKQGTYQVLRGKYGEQGSASVEAQKALARGLKEEIATQFPEINGLNAAESQLLDLQPVLERAVNRISNHQAVGIGTPIAGAAAKAVSGSATVGVVAGVLKGVLDNPNVKSRLAIMVSKANKIPISQAIGRVNTYSASLGSAALSQQGSSSDDNPNPAANQEPSQ